MASDAPKIYSVAQVTAALRAIPGDRIVDAMAEGFVAYSSGRVSVPPPQTLGQPPLASFVGHPDAQACIKSAYENGGDIFVTKVASGGGGSNSGLVMVFSQRTFRPEAILLDEGLLTEVRTAAVGALAARLFAPLELRQIGLIGGGVQAKFQLQMLAAVTPCRRVKAWARTLGKVESLAKELAAEGWQIEVVASAEQACSEAGLILTTTPSREPLVQASWVQGRPVLITAIGADSVGKQELDPALVAAADLVVVDSREQCVERGELQHAVKAGLKSAASAVELGEWLADDKRRTGARPRLVVFDSTGVAVQDVKIAQLVLNALQPKSSM